MHSSGCIVWAVLGSRGCLCPGCTGKIGISYAGCTGVTGIPALAVARIRGISSHSCTGVTGIPAVGYWDQWGIQPQLYWDQWCTLAPVVPSPHQVLPWQLCHQTVTPNHLAQVPNPIPGTHQHHVRPPAPSSSSSPLMLPSAGCHPPSLSPQSAQELWQWLWAVRQASSANEAMLPTCHPGTFRAGRWTCCLQSACTGKASGQTGGVGGFCRRGGWAGWGSLAP